MTEQNASTTAVASERKGTGASKALLGPLTARDITVLVGVLVIFVASVLPIVLRFGLTGNLWNLTPLFFLGIGVLLPLAVGALFVIRRLSPEVKPRIGSLSVDQFASVVAGFTTAYFFLATVSDFTVSYLVGLVGALVLLGATVLARWIPFFAADFADRAETPAHAVARDAVAAARRPAAPKPVLALPAGPAAGSAAGAQPGQPGQNQPGQYQQAGPGQAQPGQSWNSGAQAPGHTAAGQIFTPASDTAAAGAGAGEATSAAATANAATSTAAASTASTPDAESSGAAPSGTQSAAAGPGDTAAQAGPAAAAAEAVPAAAAAHGAAAETAGSPETSAFEQASANLSETKAPQGAEPDAGVVPSEEGAADSAPATMLNPKVVDVAPAVESIGATVDPQAAPQVVADPFWFAVDRPQNVVDQHTRQFVFKLTPGSWILALEDRGSSFLVQDSHGKTGLLLDLVGVERAPEGQ